MGEAARILCCGHDKLLLETRARVLERHFNVSLAWGLPCLNTLPARPGFALVILCHSFSAHERMLATRLVRGKWPGVAVLEVASSSPGSTADAQNHSVLGLDGPPALINAVRRILDHVAPSGAGSPPADHRNRPPRPPH